MSLQQVYWVCTGAICYNLGLFSEFSVKGTGRVIKELHKGLYEALGRKDIPLMPCDLQEPKERPGLKIYILPKSNRLNDSVRFTDYDIMILYYAKDINDYYIEHYEIMEEFEELLLGSIELENGVFVEFNEIEFEQDNDLLAIYTGTTIDTYRDTEIDDEVMEELGLFINGTKSET